MSNLADAIRRARQTIDAARAESISKLDGMTPRQHDVLNYFASHDGVSQTAAVVETGVDRSTLADIVRRLVDRGLLARKRTRHDARMYAVTVTAKGKQRLEDAAALIRAADAQSMRLISKSETVAAISVLERISSGPMREAAE